MSHQSLNLIRPCNAKAMDGIDRNLAYPLQLNNGYAIPYMYVNPGLGGTFTSYVDCNSPFKSNCMQWARKNENDLIYN